MRKLIAMLLIVVMVCCMFSATVLARDPVISPEQGNTDVDPVPSTPQTGGLPVGIFVAAAALLCVVAVVSTKKVLA